MLRQDRIDIWQLYNQRALSFWNDVEEHLHFFFAPYDDPHQDKDTPSIRKLYDMLADLNAFISHHLDELEQEA